MASVFLGINDRTFTYESTAARAEHVGAGVRYPIDFALTADDIAYIINRGREDRPDGTRLTVMKLGADGEEYISTFGSYGEEAGQFIWPVGIALDKDTNVYVTDEWLHRVTKYDKDGEYLTHWGIQGSGNGELNRPSGIAISREDTIYIVDSRNNRVQTFNLEGTFLGKFGSSGSDNGQFNLPWGMCLDKDSNVFVADWRNDRVQSFTANGEWLATFGTPAVGTSGNCYNARVNGGIKHSEAPVGTFNRPTGVCVDQDGDIYIADWLNNRVQVLSPEGRFITEFTGDGNLSNMGISKLQSNPDMIRQRNGVRNFTPEKVLWAPCAVRIAQDNRVIIADTTRHRFQIYRKNTEPTLI
ncbi:MAG: NHL repeat-containing protein [Chloroflexota bacterium]|nr:NHL repeat-containing protein [Chloroflexota bacterium]|tara:strand:- start:881 stop:1948 length:1068 start_codon:yes stop_codon:yes gene_type:complete